jgi:RimJ/RimL family protein N-acetyltransferase
MVVKDAPHLLTERLDLRLPAPADFPAIMAIVDHAETARFLGPRSGPPDHFMRFCRGAGSWLLYGYGMFVIRLRGSEEVIGNCGVFHSWRGIGEDFDDTPEAGWILRHDQVGRGIGREAMTAVLAWFDRAHGSRRVVCMITAGNEPSIALAARLGFAPLREAVLPDGDAVRLFERPAEL